MAKGMKITYGNSSITTNSCDADDRDFAIEAFRLFLTKSADGDRVFTCTVQDVGDDYPCSSENPEEFLTPVGGDTAQ